MDFIKELGPLALGSRLRRLVERLAQDVSVMYEASGVDFEPRWFPVFYLLRAQSPMSILDIAKALGITHPAVNQIATDLLKKGLVTQRQDRLDKRKRLLALSTKGKLLAEEAAPLWQDIDSAIRQVLAEASPGFMAALASLELHLDEKSFVQRLYEQQQARQRTGVVEIIDFQHEFTEDFRRINTLWIQQYFELEPADELMFRQPQAEILDPGGCILLARRQGQIIGTCALLKLDDHTYELAKMAVDTSAQGAGVGAKLLAAAIDRAKALGARQLTLETNSRLHAAIHLYQKFGFVELPLTAHAPSAFARVDRVMGLDLTQVPEPSHA